MKTLKKSTLIKNLIEGKYEAMYDIKLGANELRSCETGKTIWVNVIEG